MRPIRVLIVDDSVFIRKILVDTLSAAADIEVVGQASDGQEALAKFESLTPDVITMDVEMPRLGGLEALKQIMAKRPTPVIMVSTLTASGTATTLQALEIGAFDFVCKPNGGALSTIRQVGDDLIEKIRSAREAKVVNVVRRGPKVAKPTGNSENVILIASSTGGPRALTVLFEHLPKGLSVPVLVVQHMPNGFIPSLAKRLDRIGTLPCAEAQQGDCVTPGQALIAPSGVHMSIKQGGELAFSMEPPMHGVRPAADVLFHSAARVYGSRCVVAVLTGMGRDGAEGALAIRRAGGVVFAESEETCTVFGMPRSAQQVKATETMVPIQDMAGAIVSSLHGRLAHAV